MAVWAYERQYLSEVSQEQVYVWGSAGIGRLTPIARAHNLAGKCS